MDIKVLLSLHYVAFGNTAHAFLHLITRMLHTESPQPATEPRLGHIHYREYVHISSVRTLLTERGWSKPHRGGEIFSYMQGIIFSLRGRLSSLCIVTIY